MSRFQTLLVPHDFSVHSEAALDDATIATFQKELGAMGYAFQLAELAGW